MNAGHSGEGGLGRHEGIPRELEKQVAELVTADPADLVRGVEEFLDGLDGPTRRVLDEWSREELASLPVPIRPSTCDDNALKRAVLQRLVAEIAAAEGSPDELLEIQFAAWRDGAQSAAPYIEHLADLGHHDEAAVMARYVLAPPECLDRSRIEAALEAIGAPPDGWRDAVLEFADDPSVEAWDGLMHFTPPDAVYHRTRNTIQTLIRLGVDGNVLFLCATRHGTTPDAVELVERGLVDPKSVVDRGREGPVQALGLWLGLAARAAFARGDRFSTVRLLKEACQKADEAFPPFLDVKTIRRGADDDLNEMLDRAGVPR